MTRTLIRAVIENATVTNTASGNAISIQIDPVILRAAEILPMEAVEVIQLDNGDRFSTWVEPSAKEGEVAFGSGIKQPLRVGDRIAIIASAQLHDGQTLSHKARIVTLDATNVVIEVKER